MPQSVLLSILASLFFALSLLVFKLCAKHSIPNPAAHFFYYSLSYFALGLFLPLLQPIEIIPHSFDQLVPALPYMVLMSLGMFCFSHALFKLDVTVIAPMFNVLNVFMPGLAVLLLGEIIPAKKFIWIVMVIFSGFFATYDERLNSRPFFRKYFKDIGVFLVFIFCLSLARISASRGMSSIGYWNFNFYVFVYGVFMLVFFIPFIYKKLKVPWRSIVYLGTGVVFEFLGILCVFKAFSLEPNHVVIPTIITSLPISSLLTFLISLWKKDWLENHPLKIYTIRFTAIAIMTYAVIMTTIV